jgi:hypothetical protein
MIVFSYIKRGGNRAVVLRARVNSQSGWFRAERIAHHVRDIGAMFRRFHEMVNPEGFIAIADLDKEDGSFHTEDPGDYPVFLLIASRR